MHRFTRLFGSLLKHLSGAAVLSLLALGLATPARASQDIVQFGNSIHVDQGSSIHDAVCFFCSVKVDGTVNGDMVVFFGSVEVNGHANHDVVTFFGPVRVADDASISHDLVNFFGGVHLGENSSVGQDTVVIFGSLYMAPSASIGGNRVVQPGWLFFIPLLLIIGLVRLIVRALRYPRPYYMRSY